MRIKIMSLNCLKAEQGYSLTNGEVYGKEVYLEMFR